jgi:gas vesicle protein
MRTRPSHLFAGGGGAPSGGQILRELHIQWPAANEGDLRSAAAAWHGLAETIRDNYGMANSNATSLTSNNAGAAIAAFESYWQKFGGKQGALPLAANACDAMSSACNQYADGVATAKHKIEEAGAELAATLIIGTIGAIFTFGLSEGIAADAAAGLLAYVVTCIDDLSALVGGIVATAGDAVASALTSEAAMSVATSTLSFAASGVGGTFFGDTAASAVQGLMGDGLISGSDLTKDMLIAGLAGGATGGLLGDLGEQSGEALSKLLMNAASTVQESDPQMFVDMMTLAKSLEGKTAKVSASVLGSVTSQLITAQQINAEAVFSDQLREQLQHLAE